MVAHVDGYQPQQVFNTPVLRLRTSRHLVPGTYEITALVAGGGSAPDEKKDASTPEDLKPRGLVRIQELSDVFVEVFGRPR